MNVLSDSFKVYKVEPTYLSPRFGKVDKRIFINDDLISLNIYDSLQNNEYYISEIVCYYDKYINCLEVEYTNLSDNSTLRSSHVGSLSKYYFINYI
jgi:hypothetical protein